MIFLFEINDLNTATEIVSYGLNDNHVDMRTLLLYAFIAHIFHADLPKAASLYKRLSEFPGAPEWMGKFSKTLQAGDDPVKTNPKVKKFITDMIQNFFPQIKNKRRVK